MKELPTKAPEVAQAFASGKFTIQRTDKPFSSIALDQAHEQINAMVKGEGGAIGLTESPDAFERWMAAGPEVARLVRQFEESKTSISDIEKRHHEQTEAHQRRFQIDLESLVKKISHLGNPFAEESTELLSISTKVIANAEVVAAVTNAKTNGRAATWHS